MPTPLSGREPPSFPAAAHLLNGRFVVGEGDALETLFPVTGEVLLLTGARADSHAAQEEVFGPVLTSIRVKDAEEAVAVANRSRYGLAGAVWTRSIDRALEVARRVRCGYFWINTYGAIFGDLPFGGYGQSGLGREGGRWGYEACTELKSIMVDTTGGSSAPLF